MEKKINNNCSDIHRRKEEHIRLVLENNAMANVGSGFNEYNLFHKALPEKDFSKIDISKIFFGKKLNLPLLISSMTGGTERGYKINCMLAEAAQNFNIAMGLGSQRICLEDEAVQYTFQIRKIAPDILLFANIGAVQLNYGFGIYECEKIVDIAKADCLTLHLNPLHELMQSNGNTDFSNLLKKIEDLCKKIKVPVIVKEVGYGVSEGVAKDLINCGVSAIDVAGAGGTSFVKIEKLRSNDELKKAVAESFLDWGISTVQSIKNVRNISNDIPLIASGGLKNGVDVAKALKLGADICGFAGQILLHADKSFDALEFFLRKVEMEIKIALFCS